MTASSTGTRVAGELAPAADTATLRLGTRRSRLALAQSRTVAEQLGALGHTVEIVEIVTEGDTNAAPLTQIGGTGVFASAIRTALLEGRVDVAVHSLKDLPVIPEPGLVIAAVPTREDPRDALVSRHDGGLDALPRGACVGTGSPRRAAQLTARRDDLEVRAIRGNVDSRLRRVHSGDLDAIVLASAGLRRLGMSDQVSEQLESEVMLPAPGQGALAIECRADRADVIAAVARLDDPLTRTRVTAERALLAALEAGCTAPIGALAELGGTDELTLTAFVGEVDGRRTFRLRHTGDLADPLTVGRDLAQRLLDAGADALRPSVRSRDEPSPAVVVPEAPETSANSAATSTARNQFDQE